MTKLPLLREAIMPRIDGMQKDIKKLRELVSRGVDQFLEEGETFALAQHHLRLALEGVFHIGAHILSRLEGGRAREYAEIATRLGELEIVPREFANTKLVEMAKMRNILTHFYAKVDAAHLYRILRDDVGDIEEFLRAVKRIIERPDKFGFTIE